MQSDTNEIVPTTDNPSEQLPPTSDSPVSEPNIVYYSYSTLKNQTVCPARNYFKDLVRQGYGFEDVSLPLIFGSAAHLGIEYRLKYERNPFDVAKENLAEELEKKSFTYFNDPDYVESYRNLNVCLTNFEETHFPDLRELITDPEHQVELRLQAPFRKGFLVGKIDLALDGLYADWKTGKVPQDFDIQLNPQAAYYWHLANMNGLPVPEEFRYVYLRGINKAKRLSEKTGKMVPDNRDGNKKIITNFPVHPKPEQMESVMQNHIVPLAKAYEEGVIYKNPSSYNCKTCSYRTMCLNTDLPTILD